MNIFRVPVYYPGFDPGIQIINLQQGGPSSHSHEQTSQPRIYPLTYSVALMGIGNMPRQVIGPTQQIMPNQISQAQLQLQINGIFKSPIASGL